MPNYFIEFEAHIDESRRPENFPRSVYVRVNFDNVKSDQELKQFYNDYFMALVKNPGLTVYLNDEPIDATMVRFDQRVFIPWHMVSYFHGKATLITPNPGLRNLADPSIEPSNTPQLPAPKESVQ